MLEESTNNDLPTSHDGGAFDQPELTAHYHVGQPVWSLKGRRVVELGYGAGIITFSGPEETRHHKLLLNVVRDPDELYYLCAVFFVPKTHRLWASLLRCAPHRFSFVPPLLLILNSYTANGIFWPLRFSVHSLQLLHFFQLQQLDQQESQKAKLSLTKSVIMLPSMARKQF